MEWLGCWLCEDPRLVFTTVYDGHDSYRWEVRCGNGHRRVPVPGLELVITPPLQPAETAELG